MLLTKEADGAFLSFPQSYSIITIFLCKGLDWRLDSLTFFKSYLSVFVTMYRKINKFTLKEEGKARSEKRACNVLCVDLFSILEPYL